MALKARTIGKPPRLTSARGSSRRLSPKKLLLSKWTAVRPRHKEKHFLVTRVIGREQPETEIKWIRLEAVYSRRSWLLPWRDLTDSTNWLQGWQ